MSYDRTFTLLLLTAALSGVFLPVRAEANLVLKVIAMNPSKEQTQKVPVKIYLPKEAKPEDLVNKAELDAVYDTQQGSYYLYGEYELKAGESVEKEIEIKDIWVIPESEIGFLMLEAAKLSALLKNSEYGPRVTFLTNSIESRLNFVSESQKNLPTNPERHISEYRDNLKILEAVKTDLALERSLLAQAKTFPAAMIWRLVIFIVLFLGVLGLSSYIIWQKQAKTNPGTFYTPGK